MTPIPFIKMQGLGNDFIIIDQRAVTPSLALLDWTKLADRRQGIGCDQVILLNRSAEADIAMRIINSDGSEVAACGNATRCVGKLLLEETKRDKVSIRTSAGLLAAQKAGAEHIRAIMPPPQLEWQSIPMLEAGDTLQIPLLIPHVELPSVPTAVSMGNPHLVFLVEDVASVALETLGPLLEHHPLFPERTNVEFVQVIAPDYLKMRVWERGAGATQACGTGACASLVAAARRGASSRKAQVEMPGGALEIEWLPEAEGGNIAMTGDAVEVFRGTFDFSRFLV